MPFPFYERRREFEVLSKLSEQAAGDCSRMLVLTGRRRIGKTTLCNRAFSETSLKYLFFFISKIRQEPSPRMGRGGMAAIRLSDSQCFLKEPPGKRRLLNKRSNCATRRARLRRLQGFPIFLAYRPERLHLQQCAISSH